MNEFWINIVLKILLVFALIFCVICLGWFAMMILTAFGIRI